MLASTRVLQPPGGGGLSCIWGRAGQNRTWPQPKPLYFLLKTIVCVHTQLNIRFWPTTIWGHGAQGAKRVKGTFAAPHSPMRTHTHAPAHTRTRTLAAARQHRRAHDLRGGGRVHAPAAGPPPPAPSPCQSAAQHCCSARPCCRARGGPGLKHVGTSVRTCGRGARPEIRLLCHSLMQLWGLQRGGPILHTHPSAPALRHTFVAEGFSATSRRTVSCMFRLSSLPCCSCEICHMAVTEAHDLLADPQYQAELIAYSKVGGSHCPVSIMQAGCHVTR